MVGDHQVIGHESAQNFFAQSLKQERLCSTYLLAGAPGIGKRVLARHFAKLILCHAPKDNDPCGSCSSCHSFVQGQHPRFAERYFGDDKNKTDSMVDVVRRFIEEIYTLGGDGKHLVYLIPNFQEYSIQVQNAMLKTLEEPPAQVIFLLTVDDTSGVLDTISSRSQLINLSRLSSPELKRVLQRTEVPVDQLDLLLRLSEGRVDLALNFSREEYQRLFKWCEQKLLKPDTDFISIADELIELSESLGGGDKEAIKDETDPQKNRRKAGEALLIFERLLFQKCLERGRYHFVAMQIFNTAVEELLQTRYSVEGSGHVALSVEQYMSLAFSRLKQIMRYVAMPEIKAEEALA